MIKLEKDGNIKILSSESSLIAILEAQGWTKVIEKVGATNGKSIKSGN